jgi:membrane protease YdiL (CAAX protease family)
VAQGNRFRVWAALMGAPLLLAVSFLPFVVYFVEVAGVPFAQLKTAVEPVAVFPATVGFTLIFLMTRWFAAKDGLSLRDLGWSRPSALDLATGAAAGIAVHGLDVFVFHPWLHRVQPSFDPTAATFGLPVMLLMLTVSAAAEDALYRGYALVRLQQRFNVTVAVLSTTTFYAMLAPGPELPLKGWAAMLGLVLCGLRLWRGNLWPVLLAHLIVALSPRLWLELVTPS